MKYMMMMHAPGRGWLKDGIGTWPHEDLKAHIAFMMQLNKELQKAGEFVMAEGLASPEHAKLVRASKSGKPEITDGPFPESKELLAGYRLIDVESIDRALEIAGRASAAPGPNRVPIGDHIEVRQVMGAPPPEEV